MEIQIDIKDDKLFTDVALVVDQPGFIETIEETRKQFDFELPTTLDKHIAYKNKIYNSKKKLKLQQTIEQVRRKLRLSNIFIKVIEKAIFVGEIKDSDYSPALLFSEDSYFDNQATEPDYKYSILLSPQARDEDVLRALQKYRDEIQNYIKRKKIGDDYAFIPIVSDDVIQSKPNIRDHRQWYIDFYEAKKPIGDIYQGCIDSCPITEPHEVGKNKPKGCRCFDKSTIRKGIRAYKNLLRKSRTF